MLTATLRLEVAPVIAEPLLWSLPDPIARNDPATRKCRSETGFPVSDELEALMRAVNRLLNPNVASAQFEQWWKSIYNGYRAFDNGNGYSSGHWKLFNLFCAGMTLRPVSDVIDNGWREVYALDIGNLLPVPNALDEIDLTLWMFPTISRTLANEPWSQFGGRFLHPFIGVGGRNWVRMGEYDGRGGLADVLGVQHPFVPARPAITAGLGI